MRFFSLSVFISLLVSLSLAGDYDYADVLEKSLWFYEAQRTGYLPSDNRVPWRGDSFVTDQGDDGEDLSGGYFDGTFFHSYLGHDLKFVWKCDHQLEISLNLDFLVLVL